MDDILYLYTIRKTDGTYEEFSHFRRETGEPIFVIQSVKSKCYLSESDAYKDLENILRVEPTLPLEISMWERV